MLDCEKLVTSPASSHASTHAPAITTRRSATHSTTVHDGDHHEREEAPVDAGVEEHRVDPEVVVELVGRDDLGVQEQRLAGVLDEAHPGEQDRLGDRDAQAPQQQLAASSGPSTGARTAGRRGGRRTAGSRRPWRRRWSRSLCSAYSSTRGPQQPRHPGGRAPEGELAARAVRSLQLPVRRASSSGGSRCGDHCPPPPPGRAERAD